MDALVSIWKKIVEEVEARLLDIAEPVKVSLIGCVVNGPGEALHSDIGLVGANGAGTIYVDGKPLKRLPEDELVDELEKIGPRTICLNECE